MLTESFVLHFKKVAILKAEHQQQQQHMANKVGNLHSGIYRRCEKQQANERDRDRYSEIERETLDADDGKLSMSLTP